MLFDSGASIFAEDRDNDTPLHYAVCGGNTETAGLLLKKGANIFTKDKNNRTPLSMTIFNEGSNKMLRFFLNKTLDNSDDLNGFDNVLMSARELAIKKQDIDKFNLCLVYGAAKTNQSAGLISIFLDSFSWRRNDFDKNDYIFIRLEALACFLKELADQLRVGESSYKNYCHFYGKIIAKALSIVDDELIKAIVDKVKKIDDQKNSEDTNRRDVVKDVACDFLKDIGKTGSHIGDLLGFLISSNNAYRNKFKEKFAEAIRKSTKIEGSDLKDLQSLFDEGIFVNMVKEIYLFRKDIQETSFCDNEEDSIFLGWGQCEEISEEPNETQDLLDDTDTPNDYVKGNSSRDGKERVVHQKFHLKRSIEYQR